MLGTYSYHEIFRKTIVAFGTLFNNIELRRQDEVMKVPLAYGPKDKFLARLDQVPDPTNKRVQITLPRIGFEITGINYDSARKVSPTQKIKVASTSTKNKNVFMPVPYNIGFELAIISKNQEDGLQILEQILPVFQPHYNLAVKLLPEMSEIRDIPVVLNNIDYEDSYEGDFCNKKSNHLHIDSLLQRHTYTVLLQNPRLSRKQTSITIQTQTSTKHQERYVIKQHLHPCRIEMELLLLLLSAATDTNDNLIAVADASGITKFDSIYIDNELIRVQKISGNNLTVLRAYEGTTAAAHTNGSSVFLVNQADADLLDDS